jgi:hypothetical protein
MAAFKEGAELVGILFDILRDGLDVWSHALLQEINKCRPRLGQCQCLVRHLIYLLV